MAASIAVRAAGDLGPAIGRAQEAVTDGARLIEWRVDELINEDVEAGRDIAIRLVAESPAPCIVTCRPTWEGGQCSASETDRAALYRAVLSADAPPRYIDVELVAVEVPGAMRDMLEQWLNSASEDASDEARATGLILSMHDFEGRPGDLLQRVESAVRLPVGDVLKVAWRARSLRDNLQAFELMVDRHMPTVALCMGQFGVMSRVLAGKFGGLLMFAAPDGDHATADGQLSVREMIERYHADRIGRPTQVYGVIGWPVEHSRGPAIHNPGFEAAGHDGVYLPLPVPSEYEHFKATVGAMLDARFAHDRTLDFRGASVTLPHKTHLIDFVRERGGTVDDEAAAIGAANTLVVGDGGALRCLNTDAPAVIDALCAGMNIDAEELAEHRVAILGAGGMARAAAWAVSRLGAATTIFNRTTSRAQDLADDLNKRSNERGDETAFANGSIQVGEAGAFDCDRYDVIINCTSIGMTGDPLPDESALDVLAGRSVELSDEVAVFDTVYTPQRTALIRRAEQAGATAIEGRWLFLHQAARQFEVWTGMRAPLDIFVAAFNDPPNEADGTRDESSNS